MSVYAGTSGYSYKEWKGAFYPDQLPATKMLGYYAQQLPAVEINNTFYRLPRASVLQQWRKQVSEEFRFVVKASRRITHQKRLRDARQETEYLFTALQNLRQSLGVVLFQLPPYLRKDSARLEEFLETLPADVRVSFEFRHVSWYDEEIFALLRQHNIALCIADTGEDDDPPATVTADWGYLRLRRESYSDSQLGKWVDFIRAQAWSDTFAFFKHEDAASGPLMAGEFLKRF